MSVFQITSASATQGSVTINPDGSLSYSVPADFSADTITCTLEGTLVINSAPANRAPIAGPDAITMMAGGTLTIDALANDIDPEDEPLKIIEATADTGTVAILPEGLLSYMAPKGFAGETTIHYVIADPDGYTGDGAVTVTVTPYVPDDLPPVVAADQATVVAGGTVRIDVLRNDADPEGEALTLSTAIADQGQVSITPEGMLSYTAFAGSPGHRDDHL